MEIKFHIKKNIPVESFECCSSDKTFISAKIDETEKNAVVHFETNTNNFNKKDLVDYANALLTLADNMKGDV